MEDQKWTLDRIVRNLIYIGGIVLIILLLRVVGKYLVSFFVACILAYLFEPIVQMFMRWYKSKKRIWAVLSTLFSLIVIVGLAVMLTIPPVSRELGQMKHLMSEYSSQFDWQQYIPKGITEVETIVEDYEVKDMLKNLDFQDYFGKVMSFFGGILGSIGSGLLGLFSIVTLVMYLIFIMLSYNRLFGNAYAMLPPAYREKGTKMFKDIEKEMVVYFRGQAIIMLLVTVLYAIGFKIVGLPLAILLGILTGIFSFIPYFQYVAILPALWLAWIHALETGQSFWLIVLFVVLVFLIVQVIQEIFFVPWIQGKSTGMNPAIMLLSISVWGGLFGIIGMLIALPVTSFLINYYKQFVLSKQLMNDLS